MEGGEFVYQIESIVGKAFAFNVAASIPHMTYDLSTTFGFPSTAKSDH